MYSEPCTVRVARPPIRVVGLDLLTDIDCLLPSIASMASGPLTAAVTGGCRGTVCRRPGLPAAPCGAFDFLRLPGPPALFLPRSAMPARGAAAVERGQLRRRLKLGIVAPSTLTAARPCLGVRRMLLPLPLLVASAAAALAALPPLPRSALSSPGPVTVGIDGASPVFVVRDEFLSFNLDTTANRGFFERELSDPKLVALARSLSVHSPAFLRVGGTGGNSLT